MSKTQDFYWLDVCLCLALLLVLKSYEDWKAVLPHWSLLGANYVLGVLHNSC